MNERATLEQEKADKSVLRLREREKLHKKITELEKKLDAKQALELEIECMKNALQVMKHMGEDEDLDVKHKMDTVRQELKEKEEELKALEELNQALVIKERKSNDELQEGRKDLINEIINEDDENLRNLKSEYGDEVFNAVTTALKEMNDYNPSDRYIIPELWNFEEDRKALLSEGVMGILRHWRQCKKKKT